MPIHQDGTCNGLQHYAAMGKDLDGAKQVNLLDMETPADIYTHVAMLVEEKIKKDLQNDKTVPETRALAKKVSGQIKRKIVKQTVMTIVYGVTFIGRLSLL